MTLTNTCQLDTVSNSGPCAHGRATTTRTKTKPNQYSSSETGSGSGDEQRHNGAQWHSGRRVQSQRGSFLMGPNTNAVNTTIFIYGHLRFDVALAVSSEIILKPLRNPCAVWKNVLLRRAVIRRGVGSRCVLDEAMWRLATRSVPRNAKDTHRRVLRTIIQRKQQPPVGTLAEIGEERTAARGCLILNCRKGTFFVFCVIYTFTFSLCCAPLNTCSTNTQR